MLSRLCVAYVAGLLLPAWPARAISLALAIGWRRSRPRIALGLAPSLVLAACLGTMDRRLDHSAVPEAGVGVSLVGWIAATPERSGTGWRALVAVESVREDAAREDARGWQGERLRCVSRRPWPPYGTRLRASGTLHRASGPRNFGGYDARDDLAAAGAAGIADITEWSSLPGARGAAWRREIVEPLRVRLDAALHAMLAPAQAGLLSALLVGWRDGVDPRTAEAWRALGISHILSISGMHVGLVATGLLLAGGSPRRRRGLATLLSGLWIYAALGGLGPTVLRSCAMATWGAVALYLGRARQPLVALGLASLGLLWSAPERRFDLGLQLSCLSTAGLLVWARPLSRWGVRLAERGPKGRAAAWIVTAAGIGLAAQGATLPLVLWHFGFVSSCSPIANLVCVPLTDAALVLGLAGAPLVLCSTTLGRPMWLVSGALLYLAEAGTRALHAAFDSRLFVPANASALGMAVLAAAGALGSGVAAGAGKRRACIAMLLLLAAASMAIAWLVARPARPDWRFEALDVGQGDALVLDVGPDIWVIDSGDAQPTDRGRAVVVPHLQRTGVRRLRGLVLTHPHRDHCGGAASLLSAVRVDTLYLAAASRHDSTYARLRAQAPRVPVRWLVTGERVELCRDYAARVLWPDSTDVLGSGANGRSLVLWAHGTRFPDLLLMGDLEEDGEARLLERWGPQLASAAPGWLVLKAGHHGSNTSSSPAFLAAVGPEVALVSVGTRNRYGHPGSRTLAELERRHCRTLRTDRGGAVRLEWRDEAIWLERPGQRPERLAGRR